jgi:hypothetical protein
MSHELKKPITTEERTDFIFEYNRSQGLLIEETDLYLFALEVNEIMGEKEVEGQLIPYPVVDPDYEEEQKEKEAERIRELYMTRSDFFDGLIRAFGIDEDDLLPVLQQLLVTLPIEDVQKKIALNNYKNALNFYRKHDLFTLLSGVTIPVTPELSITIESEQWDRFFDETNKRNPDAYKELLPPVVEENNEEQSQEEEQQTETEEGGE